MVNVLTGAAMLAFYVIDRALGRFSSRGRHPFEWRTASPRFTPQQAARFTRVAGGACLFDASVASSIVDVLRYRSAKPIELPGVDARAGIWAWEICALQSGRERAADVIDRATARGMVAFGSLSLVLLKTGLSHEPILIVTTPDLVARVAPPGGEMAVLSQPIVTLDPPIVTPPAKVEEVANERIAPVSIAQVAKPRRAATNGVQAPAAKGAADEPPSRAADA